MPSDRAQNNVKGYQDVESSQLAPYGGENREKMMISDKSESGTSLRKESSGFLPAMLDGWNAIH